MSFHRIFLVEDHPTMREAIASLLAHLPEMELVGTAATAEEAAAHLAEAEVELVLVDVSLPGMSGIEFARRLHERGGPACLMVSGHTDAVYVRRSRAAGALGYVAKGDPDALVEAIEAVLGGRTWFGDVA